MIVVRVKQIRKSRGLTLREMARLSGMAPSTMTRVENGLMEPRLITAYRIAEVLQSPITEVFVYNKKADRWIAPASD